MKILTDIGGTYARFAVSEGEDIIAMQKYEAAAFDSFEATLAHYVEEQDVKKAPLRIATAAYPDDQGSWRFVNRNEWVINPQALAQNGWEVERILNDFEACVYGLIDLPEKSELVLKPGKVRHDFSKCLLGPGTGLGLGYLRADGAVQKTHGGHMLATAVTQEQRDVVAQVQTALDKDKPLVFENFVSGPGLMNIYRAICKKPKVQNPEELLDNAQGNEERNALRLFHEFMGLFAHTVVVTGHAYGGLYLTGGVLDRLVEKDMFDFEHFEKFFALKGVSSVQEAVNNTPIIRITDSYLSLKGVLRA